MISDVYYYYPINPYSTVFCQYWQKELRLALER